MDERAEIYQSIILDHAQRPRNFSVLASANRVGSGNNPICGDQVSVFLEIKNGCIANISFQGHGCAISQASASLMTLHLKGKTLAETEAVYQKVVELVTTGLVEDDGLTELAALSGVHRFPARVKCATLGWHAALNAVRGMERLTTTE